jgi:hypothetical protein
VERGDFTIEHFCGRILAHRSHDHATCVLGHDLLHHFAEAGPGRAVADLAADADA